MGIVWHQFMDLIDNKEVEWVFNVVGDLCITGRVIDYKIRSDATPITLKVQQEDRSVVEIPWTSVQTIKLVHPENY